MKNLAEEILLDHRIKGNNIYLLTSPSRLEGTSYVVDSVAENLCSLHAGEVFLYRSPNSHEDTEQVVSDDVRIEFFSTLKKEYSIILIDISGLLTTNQVTPFLDIVDTSVLIIKAGQTRRALVSESLEKIRRQNISLLGVFLNGQRRVIPNWLYRLIP